MKEGAKRRSSTKNYSLFIEKKPFPISRVPKKAPVIHHRSNCC